MCGIVLTINAKATRNYKIPDFFRDALIASQVRGVHATGIMQLDNNGMDIEKKAMSASDFVQLSRVKAILNYAGNQTVTVGHVRHATQGNKDEDNNAHPFDIVRDNGSRLTGVHNGSLRSWYHKKKSSHEVDSHWALELIAEKGLDAFKEIDGAYCFVWYDDEEPDTLFICRNHERPLHLIIDEKAQTMYGASEAGMLEWLVEKHGILKPDEMVTLIVEDKKLYSIDLNTLDITTENVPAYVAPPVTTNYNYNRRSNGLYNNYGYEMDEEWNPNGTPSSTTSIDYTELNLARIGRALDPPKKPHIKLEAASTNVVPFVPKETSEREETLVWGLACNVITAQHIPAMSVTNAEIEMAKGMDCYGQMVCWEPVMFDDRTSPGELLGDVHYVQDGQRQKIEGSLRYIQKTRATNDFLTSGKTVFPMMVIGANTDNNNDVYLILGELSAIERKLLFNDERTTAMITA